MEEVERKKWERNRNTEMEKDEQHYVKTLCKACETSLTNQCTLLDLQTIWKEFQVGLDIWHPIWPLILMNTSHESKSNTVHKSKHTKRLNTHVHKDTHLQASPEPRGEATQILPYFGCEVGICTDCVPSGYSSYHGHHLTGQRHLCEPQFPCQRPHSLLMSRPPKTH